MCVQVVQSAAVHPPCIYPTPTTAVLLEHTKERPAQLKAVDQRIRVTLHVETTPYVTYQMLVSFDSAVRRITTASGSHLPQRRWQAIRPRPSSRPEEGGGNKIKSFFFSFLGGGSFQDYYRGTSRYVIKRSAKRFQNCVCVHERNSMGPGIIQHNKPATGIC